MPAPEVETRVGHADWGENRFRGHRVNAELVGVDGWASILSLAAGGRRLAREEAELVEDLAVCSLAADPRIWPLKASRLVASYGSVFATMAAGHLVLDGTMMGPAPTGAAASMLIALKGMLGDRAEDPRAVEDLVDDLLSTGRVAGFGVAFRGADERVDAIKRCVAARRREGGIYWRLLTALESAVREKRDLHVNLGLAAAAVLLDLGMQPRAITVMMSGFLDLCFYANAVEGAEQKSEGLRRLPDDAVRYEGPPPRLSPRAARTTPGPASGR